MAVVTTPDTSNLPPIVDTFRMFWEQFLSTGQTLVENVQMATRTINKRRFKQAVQTLKNGVQNAADFYNELQWTGPSTEQRKTVNEGLLFIVVCSLCASLGRTVGSTLFSGIAVTFPFPAFALLSAIVVAAYYQLISVNIDQNIEDYRCRLLFSCAAIGIGCGMTFPITAIISSPINMIANIIAGQLIIWNEERRIVTGPIEPYIIGIPSVIVGASATVFYFGLNAALAAAIASLILLIFLLIYLPKIERGSTTFLLLALTAVVIEQAIYVLLQIFS